MGEVEREKGSEMDTQETLVGWGLVQAGWGPCLQLSQTHSFKLVARDDFQLPQTSWGLLPLCDYELGESSGRVEVPVIHQAAIKAGSRMV